MQGESLLTKRRACVTRFSAAHDAGHCGGTSLMLCATAHASAIGAEPQFSFAKANVSWNLVGSETESEVGASVREGGGGHLTY